MEYKIGTDARCAVIGYGSWATAIVGLLAANGQRVGWYVRNPEVLESLRTEGRNPRYLSDLEFDRDCIAPSDDLDAVVRGADSWGCGTGVAKLTAAFQTFDLSAGPHAVDYYVYRLRRLII